MADSFLLLRILEAMNRVVLNDLELTKAIRHSGEGGRAREQILTSFLEQIVPDAYGISTGFVIDVHGSISRQVDVIIYRKDYHPRLQIGRINHFMVEGVVAVIEVKASIKSTERLTEALENIRSVKALDRTGGGRNYLLTDRRQDILLDPDNFSHQVFGAIVTEESLTDDTLSSELRQFVLGNPRPLWPNLYVDAKRLTVGYRNPLNGLGAVPEDATGLAIWNQPRNWSPLVELAFEVINLLRVAPSVDYSPSTYLGPSAPGTTAKIVADLQEVPGYRDRIR